MTRLAALTLAAGTVLVPMPALAEGPLDLERVTLYRSGVGSFEWRGLVDGDADVSLSFDKEQMPDILKSMVLLDAGGGTVDAVRYDADEPLERRLGGFAVDVGTGSFESVFVALRGTEVRLERTGVLSSIEGRILGTGRRATGESQRGSGIQYVTLLDGDGVRSVDFAMIRSFTILDKELAERINGMLTARSESRDEHTAGVDLRFRGDGVRPVIVGYVHESPVWKTSYRLVLPEDSGDDAMLQGWAIVENTTDDDWDDVALTLVSGRPVGFTMDLYEPLFVERPEVPVPVEMAAMPKIFERGRGGGGQSPFGSVQSASPAVESESAVRLGRSASSFSDEVMAAMAPEAQATAGERGELFVFELDQPVTIERRRSAMIPLLTSDVSVRRVSIFNAADLAAHPMRGVEVTNDSGLKLMPGPVTVFDDGAFAGDAQIGSLAADETRLLAHAVDLDVSVVSETENTAGVSAASIRSRAVRITRSATMTTTHAFTNRAEADRTIIVEFAKRPGWTLRTPGNGVEETESGHRFEVTAAAGETTEAEIVYERVDRDTITLTDRPLAVLAQQLRGQRVSPEVIEAVERGASLQASLDRARRRVGAIDSTVQRITDEQARIRGNMSAVSRDSDLYRRYLAELTSQEDRIGELRTERDAAERAVEAARAELDAYLSGLRIG
ncbi:MAG: hypothetical protein AAF297_04200 [Planctomycetota bacterium]